ncbi:MAG TPA: GNAT family N-acetyltransferase [Bryobacteraceae bacterium]|jgi:ribosomal protein S18 acetylase RimI-like enzyme|nr:GNAT family N-acetyltransferase [Bryobacteraceae bacterium]
MAALAETSLPETVELSRVGVTEMDALLTEEIQVWEKRFSWDFRPSADLLRRFLNVQSLNGYALRAGRDVLGYAYHVCEDHKGLIGDFYVRSASAASSAEMLLLSAMVQDLMLSPGIRRIESQLMLAHLPLAKPLPFSKYLTRHDRNFMEVPADAVRRLAPGAGLPRVSFHTWIERYQEETAHLISAAYRGHVDSEINDQYRTIPGARRFLMNIVKFPGCGRFSPPSSVVVLDDATGRVCGVCLASLVSANSGHVTQLCVLPGMRGARIGYEALRQCLVQLTNAGCRSVSLTVTCSNIDAIRLYQSVGFKITSIFPALVWEGF